jgi:subtilisin family serine protease
MKSRNKILSIIVLVVLVLTSVLASSVSAAPQQAGSGETYVVLYKGTSVPADAATAISKAGGTLVYSYDKIGVAIARSENASFKSNLTKDNKIEGVSATSGVGVQLNDVIEEEDAATDVPSDLNYQWDMIQIHVPEAHAITTGSPDVVVGDIDTGLDYTHTALAPNVDFSRSVSCIGGVPNQDPAAWMDHHGHGTHTAGTIAARPFTVGSRTVVGVAPDVKIAGIKAGNDDGYFFPEAVICAFMWAGDHDIAVTNNSYYADPWLFNCRNDKEQHAIWKAEQRAIRYAMSKGVVVVAAEGNENIDLSKKNFDDTSPDYPPGSEIDREVTNACVVIPVEISGVVGVTAVTQSLVKAGYSSYGVGVADVTAPGSSVYSTYPNNRIARLSGTSMASPHAAGVAALIVSQSGGKGGQGSVAAKLQNTADPWPCPETSTSCVGGNGYNGFYGHGQVNAFNAVSR